MNIIMDIKKVHLLFASALNHYRLIILSILNDQLFGNHFSVNNQLYGVNAIVKPG